MTAGRCCPVVELRQYTLHPGTRETLIELFDREFVETQEAVGMQVIAQFRDIDRPDVFTWLRGFPDMDSRAASLSAFYDGPVWAAHREAANSTMISWDNVRLLHPARAGAGFILGDREADARDAGLVIATIYTLRAAAAAGFASTFFSALAPRLAAAGAVPMSAFETEPSRNTFPRGPVREGEHAFVWFAHFGNVEEYDRHASHLAADRDWASGVQHVLDRSLVVSPEVWRLTPTARSRRMCCRS